MIRTTVNRPIIGITADIEGEYYRLKHDYCHAVEEAGGIPVVLTPVGFVESHASVIHGLLIPGGADLDPAHYSESASETVRPVSRLRSDFEITMLREVTGMNKPVLGICYGMQLLNVFFGGSLYQDIDAQLPVAINHKSDYHTVVIAENRFLTQGVFSVNSSHHQAIKTMGKGLLPIAYSEDQIIEAFCGKDYRFLVGVQWHPERMRKDGLSRHVFHSFIQASYASG